MTTAAYPASPIKKRVRRTKAQMADLHDAIVIAVEAEAPVTLRGVFYRCVSAGAVAKTENSYDRIGDELVKLRRQGRVDYADITDGTRWITKPRAFDSIEEALTSTARLYRRRLWTESIYSLSLFTEKDAISGVILPVTDRWDVPLGVMRGYCSESFAWSVARTLNPDKINVLGQLGDHDPSGVGAWADFTRKVRGFAPDTPTIFTRIAVLPEQIVDYDLPLRPTKKSDTRAKNWIGGSVEVDAIPAPTIRALVEEWIDSYVDPDALVIAEAAEHSERQVLTRLASRWAL